MDPGVFRQNRTMIFHMSNTLAPLPRTLMQRLLKSMNIEASRLIGFGRRKPEDFFIAVVDGNSMYPHFQNGDELLCLRCSDMGRSGRIGILVFGNDEATLKRIEYQPGENWIDLVPINPEYQTKRIQGADLEQCRVVGRVIKVIRTVDET